LTAALHGFGGGGAVPGPSGIDPQVEFVGVEPNEMANPNEWDLSFGNETANLSERNTK
jgi:hypothetical protein